MNTQEIIENLTCNALEGGSNYWYQIVSHNQKVSGSDYLSEVPTTEKGFVMISDEVDGEEGQLTELFKLNREALIKGLEVMKTKYDWHYKNVVDENDDAETADVFLQCAVFGEIVYG